MPLTGGSTPRGGVPIPAGADRNTRANYLLTIDAIDSDFAALGAVNPFTVGGHSIADSPASKPGLAFQVTGDVVERFLVEVGGALEWGPGGSGALDTTLARTGVGALGVTGELTVSALLTAGNGLAVTTGGLAVNGGGELISDSTTTKVALGVQVNGDSQNRWYVRCDGLMEWGPGSGAADTVLQRTGVATLGLTGALTVSGLLTASDGLTVISGGAAITGNSTLTGTLHVSGLLTPSGGLSNASVAASALASGAAASNLGGAGGVLNGSYPNPGMASGAAASNLGGAGGVLNGSYPNPGMASGVAASNLGAAGGDLNGSYPNPTIAAQAVTAAKVANATLTSTQLAGNAATQVVTSSGQTNAPATNAGSPVAMDLDVSISTLGGTETYVEAHGTFSCDTPGGILFLGFIVDGTFLGNVAYEQFDTANSYRHVTWMQSLGSLGAGSHSIDPCWYVGGAGGIVSAIGTINRQVRVVEYRR